MRTPFAQLDTPVREVLPKPSCSEVVPPHPVLDRTEDVLDDARRTRMALGILSRRRCMASITASCSQRVMRRCLLGVHMAFRTSIGCRARVDTVHGQGFADIWVMKSGKR
jgi:hypothetical protein